MAEHLPNEPIKNTKYNVPSVSLNKTFPSSLSFKNVVWIGASTKMRTLYLPCLLLTI